MSEAYSLDLYIPAHYTRSAEQIAAQATTDLRVILEGNAGAAKTTTLALRMAQALHRGAAPERILALTYTRPAVQALRRALIQANGVPAEVVDRIWLSTFDDFCTELLLRIEGEAAVTCVSAEHLKPYVERAIERAQTLPNERYPDELWASHDASEIERLLDTFDGLKGSMLREREWPEQHLDPALAEALGFDYATLRFFSCYERVREGGHPDHPEFRGPNDATYDLARRFVEDPLEAARASDNPLNLGLHLIVLDEMHDTNRAMFTVLAGLIHSNPRTRFVGVGDRDQVIHSAAGADHALMGSAFDAEIGVAKRLPLSLTHRFGEELARPLGRLARKDYRAIPGHRTDLRLLPYQGAPRLLWQEISHAINAYRKAAAQGQQSGRVAVLLRLPQQSIPIEHAFLRYGVPYRTEGFKSYLQRREVLLVRGLQAYAAQDFGGFPSPAARERTLTALMMFSGAKIDSRELRRKHEIDAQRTAIKQAAATPAGCLDFVANHVLRSAAPELRQPLLSAVELLRGGEMTRFTAEFLSALQPRRLAMQALVRQADITVTEETLGQLCETIAQEESLAVAFRVMHEMEGRLERTRPDDAVCLSSIASAKGLEFDWVLMPGLNKGEFAVGGDSVENRNMLYVGMSRARRQLTLIYDPSRPSAYLRDLGLLS